MLRNNPYKFNTSIQDVALVDPGQLQFSSWKYRREFNSDYASIANKIGKSFDKKFRR